VTDDPLPRSATILLVEDEESIRHLVHAILTEQGFTLLTARDGAEALRLSQEPTQSIDLLLADLMLPGRVNGVQVARQMVERHPALKVLYTSGFPIDELTQRGIVDPGWPFLPKPFTVHDLLAKVDEVLSGLAVE
jgi:DNA-binding response OmpR family regulator